jgi:hypothetical protein
MISKGVLGLYGGLASKLACSAPISAIYTLTYETVKGALLPVFPKVISVSFMLKFLSSLHGISFVETPHTLIRGVTFII